MKSLSTLCQVFCLSVFFLCAASVAHSNSPLSKDHTEKSDFKSDIPENLVLIDGIKNERIDLIFDIKLWSHPAAESSPVYMDSPICNNVTNGGTISGSLSSSGPLAGPITIQNTVPASGGSGALEYVWMKSHVDVINMVGNSHWSMVPGQFGESLTLLGPITQTTYYLRCARRAGCDFYYGESNRVDIVINPSPLAIIDCADITQNSTQSGVLNSDPSCGSHPNYAFWSGNLLPGNNKFWTISDGMFNEFANGTASFTGTVTNIVNPNWIFHLNVLFSGKTFTPPTDSPKAGNCVSDVSGVSWYYYPITQGILSGDGALNGAVVELSRMGESFQVGTGAHLNDPNVYGASGWLNFHILSQPTNGPTLESVNGHGDFNFELPQGPDLLDIPTCSSICAGQSVELYATSLVGEGPFSYLWSTGESASSISVSPNSTTTYTVTVTDANDGITITSIEVTVFPQMELTCNSTDASEWEGEDGTVGIDVSGGVQPYSYLWNTGATTPTIQNVPAGVYSVMVTDAIGCQLWKECFVNQPTTTLICEGFRTQTQGGWGSPPNGGNPGAYLHANFGVGFPSGIQIGCDNTFSFTSAQSITDFLPCGGTPAGLPAGADVDPGCPGNVFISQVLAATISIGFDDNIPAFSSGLVLLRELVISYGTFAGWTVEELLLEANSKLGGCASSFSFSELNDAVTAVNENYVDGNVTGDFLDCCILTTTCTPTNGDCSNGNKGSISATLSEDYEYQWVNDSFPEVILSSEATVSNLDAGSYTLTVTNENGCTSTCTSIITVEPCCNVNDPGEIGIDLEACGQIDGPIVIGSIEDPSGGLGELEIVWMTSDTLVPNIVGNPYWTLVTDSIGLTLTVNGPITENVYYIRCARRVGCTNFYTGESNTVSIIINPAPTVLCDATNGDCTNGNLGSITANPSGGTAQYTYAWSHGPTSQTVTGLSAGTYSVIITDAEGCTATCTNEITITPCCNVNDPGEIGIDLEACGQIDGPIVIGSIEDPTGGLGDLEIVWMTSDTLVPNIVGNPYWTLVTDSIGLTLTVNGPITENVYYIRCARRVGCTNFYTGESNTVSIIIHTPPTIECAFNAAQCGELGSASVSVLSGTGPFTYLWNNGATTASISGLGDGTYSVIVTDANGCSDECEVTIANEPALAIECSAGDNICLGDEDGTASVSILTGTAPYTYSWSTGETTASISGLEAGTYSVEVTDANGCTASCSVTIGSVPPPLVEIVCDEDPIPLFGEEDYDVENATGCYSFGYAFWTNTILSNYSAGPHWSVVDGSFVENLAGTALFTGTFVNNDDSDLSFDFNVVFGGKTYAPPADSPKETGGPCSFDVDNSDWYYYTTTNGTLIGTGDLAGAVINLSRSGPAFQLGTGANENDMSVFGASGWLNFDILSNPTSGPALNAISGHCDFNITLPFGPQLTDIPSCLTICEGESVELFATALPVSGSYTYLWSTGDVTASISVSPTSTTVYSVTVTDTNTGCSTEVEITVTVNDLPTFACNSTNGICGELGSATVSVAGGIFDYSFLWSTGATGTSISGLVDGTYTVVVTDNETGCTDSCSVTIANTPALAVECSSENGQCGDSGSASVSVATGTGPYTYLWNNGAITASISGLADGTYSVVVTDANGCSDECEVTILNEPALAVECSSENGQCGNSGSASVSVTTGTGPYTYLWNNGAITASISGLADGIYSVVVTDANGCSDECEVIIANEPALAIECSAGDNICLGDEDGTASVSILTGTAPYTYSWSTGETTASISGLEAGTYSVEVTDANGCTASCSVTIGSVPPPLVEIVCDEDPIPLFGEEDYDVENATGCYSFGYAFWTNTILSNYSAGPHWSVVDGSFVENLAGTALFTGTFVNNDDSDLSFDFNVVFGGKTYAPPADSPKETGGPCSFDVDNSDWYYYTTTNGTLIGTGDLAGAVINLSRSGPAFQLGTGANENDMSVFGASGWLNFDILSNPTSGPALNATSGHCDFNITLPFGPQLTDIPSCLTICEGESVELFATALPVSGSYTYLWSTGDMTASISVSPTSTTVYSVTVTDTNTGCSSEVEITVTVNELPTFACNSTNGVCGELGSATVSVAGGIVDYSFLWSTGATGTSISGLVDGTYTVVVTDNETGCTDSCSVTIANTPALAVECSSENGQCGDSGSASVSVATGTGPYTYLWNNGATTASISGLGDGTYSVIVTDANGCTDDCSITILNEPALSVSCASDNGQCGELGSASVSVSTGTGPYTYLWNNGAITASISGLADGTYSVVVTDANGCSDECEVIIANEPALAIECSAGDNICLGDEDGTASVSVNTGTGPYTYLWSNGETTASISGLEAGVYSVEVTDANGCTASCSVTIGSVPPPLVEIVCDEDPIPLFGEEDYDVENATGCYSFGYAFWTNTILSNYSAGPHWSVVDGSFVENLAGTALFTGTFVNNDDSDLSFDFNVVFGGKTYAPPADSPKETGGPCSFDVDNSDWYYYTTTNGTLIGTGDLAGAVINLSRSGPAFQLGTGANENDMSVFGASGWLNFDILSNPTSGPALNATSGHCDFNITLPFGPQLTDIPSCLTICEGESVELFATALPVSGVYTYLWSTGDMTASISVSPTSTTVYSVTVTDTNTGCSSEVEITVTVNDLPTFACNSTNGACGELGSATVSVAGGIVDYSFLWSTGATGTSISGLVDGTYTVVVTDNETGCTDSCSVTIVNTPPLAVECSSENGQCGELGSASVSVSTGTGPYTYLWNNGAITASISELADGTYSVVVTDANGCSDECEVIIANEPALIAECASENGLCGGSGSASVDVLAGSGDYSYAWSNGETTASISGLADGTYSVIVTDNETGCTATCEVTIANEPALIAECASENGACGNLGSASVDVTAGSGDYGYVWSNGETTASISGLADGTYSVIVTDNETGCIAICEVTIANVLDLDITCSADNTICLGDEDGTASVSVNSGTGPYTYSWSNGETTASISGLEAGIYSVEVIDANGCTASCSVTIGSVPPPLVEIVCDEDPIPLFGEEDYDVENATGCYSFGYAFWTNTILSNYSAGPHWSVVDGSFVENLAGTALFTGTFVNNDDSDLSFDFNVVFGGKTYAPPADSPKETGGPCSFDVDNSDWYYYTTTNGTLIGTGDLAGAVINLSRSGPAFQLGTGANENDMSVFGASGWLNFDILSNPTSGPALNATSGHCDFNITLPFGPQLTDIPSCLTICEGESVELFATALPVSGSYTYLWSTGDVTASISVSPTSTTVYSVTVTDTNTGCSTTTEVIVTVNDAPEVTCASENGLCGGSGSASVDVLGGSGDYSYAWSNGETTASISGLADGTYSVIVTDNETGCTATCEVTIANEPALIAECASENGLCGGSGSASVDVLGGSGDYSYAWSNGETTASISGLADGTYSVIVTDNDTGCTATCEVNIANEPALIAECASENGLCGGSGSASVDVLGGSGDYGYAWSNGETTASISGLADGTYSVIVTDNETGCTATCEVTIANEPALIAECASENGLCGGSGSASVDVLGGSGDYSYAWSNGETTASISGLADGTYSVIVTDNETGCTATCEVTIANELALVAECASENGACGNLGSASVDATGGSGDYGYVWSNGETTASISGLADGTYSVIVTDNETGCIATCEVTIANVLDLDITCSAGNTICLGDEDGTASVSVNSGTGPYTYSWSNGETTASISGLEAGIYSVEVIDANGCTASCSVTIGSVPPPLVEIACDEDPIPLFGEEDYDVENATGCYSFGYAFWTNNLLDGYAVGPHWSIIDGSFVENLAGTALFTGTFVNNDDSDLSFDFNVVFGGKTYIAPLGSPKETGGPCSADVDNTDWYYYTTTNGTLIGTGDLVGAVVNISRTGPAFQLGTGANENNQTDFGASGWFTFDILNNPTSGPAFNANAGHGDFNITLPFGPQLTDIPSCLTICEGESVELFATALPVSGSYTYLWSTGEVTASILVSPNVTSDYTVTVWNGGCASSATVTVTVEDCTIIYDCPALEANIGDSCDDQDASTGNDIIGAECECAGTIISCTAPDFGFTVTNDCEAENYDVSALLSDFGTSNFINISITRSDAIPVNPIVLISALTGQSVNIISDVPFGVTVTTSIEGSDPACNLSTSFIEQICPDEFDCSLLQANIGDSCDDGDETTDNDVLNSDCECAGTPMANAIVASTIPNWNATCVARNVTVKLMQYDINGNQVITTFVETLNDDGSFSLTNECPTGTYDILFKVDGGLAVLSEDVTLVSGLNTITTEAVVLGDINNDNRVNLLDISALGAGFGSVTGNSNFNFLADLNCDGNIGIIDVSIINNRFGRVGDKFAPAEVSAIATE